MPCSSPSPGNAVTGSPCDDVLRIFRETSDKPDTRLRTVHAGYGVVNMTDAVKWLLGSLN